MPPTSLRVYLTLGLALGPVLAALLGWPGPALAVSEPERLWTVGDRAFQDGLFAQSRRMLERLLERYPSDSRAPDATLLLGKARLSLGQHEAALQTFRQAQTLSPVPGRPDEARFWEGETLFRMKRYPEARAIYDRILTDNPNSPSAPDAVYGLAWVNLELKRRDQAVTEFRRLLSSYPENANVPSATFYLARTLTELKRPDEAIGLLRGFVSKYPDHRLLPDARYTLGQALIAGGQSDEGVGELRAFVKAYPSSELAPTARRTVVDTLVRQGKKGELAEEYKTLVAQSPATAEGLYDAGLVAGRDYEIKVTNAQGDMATLNGLVDAAVTDQADLIVTLSPEAHHKALELTRTLAAEVEYWPTADPTAIEGSREQRLDAYRDVRDQLVQKIRGRFGRRGGGNE